MERELRQVFVARWKQRPIADIAADDIKAVILEAVDRGAKYRAFKLFALIRRINADGIALLLVEQNVVQSLEVAQRAYVLDNGVFVLKGSAADLRNDPDLKRAYLGM